MRKHEFDQKSFFMHYRIFKNMHNIVSFKTYITYGEQATHTFLQDFYHEQAIRYSLIQAQISIEGQDRNINNLTTHITIPHLW